MAEWTSTEWAAFLTSATAAFALVAKTLFSGCRDSRCHRWKCCCCEMERTLQSKQEEEEEQEERAEDRKDNP